MSKTYERLFTDAGPVKPHVAPTISISAGKMRVIAVSARPEGRLSHLSVEQITGAAVGYTVELLTSQIPWLPGEYPTGTVPLDVVSLYRIIPQQSAPAGGIVESFSEFGNPYANVDGDATVTQAFIYLVIQPDPAAPATTWKADIRLWSDTGN